MFKPSTLLQYVRDVTASATFYSGILGKPPVEQSPGFALFLLGDGAALGLWQRDDVQPPVSAQAGAAELAMVVPNRRSCSSCTMRGARSACRSCRRR